MNRVSNYILHFVFAYLIVGCEHVQEIKKEVISEVKGVFEKVGLKGEKAGKPIEAMTNTEILEMLYKFSYVSSQQGSYVLNENLLPKSHSLDISEGGYIWPDQYGGIASRKEEVGLQRKILYTAISESNIYGTNTRVLRNLSPAEKYDIFMSDFDYPTVRAEIDRTNVKKIIPGTSGYQPGYIIPSWLNLVKYQAAVISSNKFTFEPKEVVSPGGVNLVFSRDDLLSLATWYYFSNNMPVKNITSKCPNEVIRSREALLGSYLKKEFFEENKFYENLNSIELSKNCFKRLSAASFHLAVVNEIGINNSALVFENLDHKFTVTGVAYGYQLEETLNGDGTIDVEMTVNYLDLFSNSDKEETYSYRLYVDRKNRVIGGAWIGKNSPDYLWLSDKSFEFDGYYKSIDNLVGKKAADE